MRLLLALLLLVFAAHPAAAQTRAPSTPDSLLAQRLRLADRLLAQRQSADAVGLLEALRLQHPAERRVDERLLAGYRAAARYPDALATLDRLDKGQPPLGPLALARAEVLALAGDTAQAHALWARLLGTAPAEPALARVLPSMASVGRVRGALALLDALPEASRRTAPVVRAAAHLSARTGDAPRAVRLYLGLVDEDPRQAPAVEDSLARLAEVRALRAPVRAALDARLEAYADPRGLRALFDGTAEQRARLLRQKSFRSLALTFALAARDGAAALAHARTLDRLANDEGRTLVRAARAALDADLLGAADSAYAAVLDRYPRAEAARDARLGRAAVAEREAVRSGEVRLVPDGAAARAADLLAAFARAYPDDPAAADALVRLGRLHVDGGDAAAARRALDEVARRFARSPAADEAAYELARLLVREGQLREAGAAFDALAERLGAGDLADRARFERATLLLYQGRLDEAATLLGDLAARAASDAANDALELGLLVQDAQQDSAGTDLARYGQARLRLRQGRAAEAADSLSALATDLARRGYVTPLVDDVLFLRATALQRAEAHVFAAEGFDALARRFPASPLADAALLALADVYAHGLSDPAAARDALVRLLDAYPGSVLADEARARLDRLAPDR